jgi:hypothetical protein
MDNFELTECIYECIKDTFYYGVFGDFKLGIDKASYIFGQGYTLREIFKFQNNGTIYHYFEIVD